MIYLSMERNWNGWIGLELNKIGIWMELNWNELGIEIEWMEKEWKLNERELEWNNNVTAEILQTFFFSWNNLFRNF